MTDRLEIMAPVGGREQLTAALRCRADAVYFGLPDFNARRNAENFAAEGLDGIVQECHHRGVNVYITINTVVMDSELAAAKRAVDAAASAGADAIIVQDLAVAAYARQAWPDLKLCASTQMAIHNAAGARLAKQAGFSRVVLARELSLPEIRQIIEETGIETEVFVHGAHCMSVSGNCYLSSVIGGRSGNRGLCAQPCRLDWTCGGADHCLSLKDLSYVEHIRELQKAGVCSLKIEGRMKRAEYVAAAVTACRKALAGEEPDLEALRSVFSRSGFTDGYLTGRRDASMYGYRTKEDVLAAAGVLKDLAKLYEKEEPLHSVDLFFLAKEGQPAELRAVCEGQSAAVTGPVPETALRLELTEETVRRSLEKTGGTLYRIGRLRCAIDPGLMLPASALNAMRREALEKLDGMLEAAADAGAPAGRSARPADAQRPAPAQALPAYRAPEQPQLRLRFTSVSQLFDVPKDAVVILPLAALAADPSLLARFAGRLQAEIPAMLWPGREAETASQLRALAARGLTDVYCDNYGALQMGRAAGLVLHAGPCLNLTNSEALQQMRDLGACDAVVSFELPFAELRRMRGAMPRGILAYGFLPLMKLRSCPVQAAAGCKACGGSGSLTDRTGRRFAVLCHGREYEELLNCVPLYIGDRARPSVDFELLSFTNETREQAKRVTEWYLAGEALPGERTGGLYYRKLL